MIAVDMTTQNPVPCGLQAVVVIHRNQGQLEVVRLKRERARVTEERDIVTKAAMSFAQESRAVGLHAGAGLGVSPAAHVSSVTGEPKRLLDLAASARESPCHTNQALIARMRVLHQQTRGAYGARTMGHLLTQAGCPLFPGHLSP